MKPYVAQGRIHKGELLVRELARMQAHCTDTEDCDVTLTLEQVIATRSPQANRYYWSVAVARIARTWNKTPTETHELLKAQFLPWDEAEAGRNGVLLNGLVIGGSTTRLDSAQFFTYLERIADHAALHWDTVIPPPDPLWREHPE